MATYGIDEPIPEYFSTRLPTPASNIGPSSLMSNLGGLLFAGADSGLSDYLTRDQQDRKSTRLNSSHVSESRMPSSA